MFAMFSAVLAAILLISTLSCGYQINAWFIEKDTIRNESTLSNFQTQVEYSIDGSSYTKLAQGGAIAVTPDNVNTLKIRISYKGVSQAYMRVKLYGSFYNKNSGTYLPQAAENDFRKFQNNSSWVLNDGFYYYKQKLGNDRSTHLSSFKTISTLTMQVDVSSLNKSQYQDYAGNLYVIVDAVQPDRYQPLWGIESLPF